MEARRLHSHHHHGGRGHSGNGSGGHRRGRGRGGRGGSSGSNHSAGRGSNWFKGEGYNDYEVVSIDEAAVGISGFLSPSQPGFSGLVKQRFSDYIVHEIARTGAQVVLTSVATKKKSVNVQFYDLVAGFAFGSAAKSDATGELEVLRALSDALATRNHEQQLLGAHATDAYNRRKLIAIVGTELGAAKGKDFADFVDQVADRKRLDAERRATLAALAAVGSSAPRVTDHELVFYISGLNDKRDRVVLHEAMRRYGKALIVADTIATADNNQRQVIRVRRALAPGEAAADGERDQRKEWPVNQPEYLQFVLYRRNKDIVGVVNQLASLLKVSPTIFSFAEPKDKRGITTQLCTAYRLPRERLEWLQKFHGSRRLDEYQYLVGGRLQYVSRAVGPGDCIGNRFAIVIRALGTSDLATPAAVDTLVSHWRTHGFVNFYGLQRFGTFVTLAHVVGRAVLRKDFKLAVLLLLKPQDGEATKLREAREHFRQHKDVAAALRMLPPFLVPERAVLEGLLQHGSDAHELAFRCIPLNYRVAYVDAYLNYVWNEMASLRIAQLPTDKPVVGDLVRVSKPVSVPVSKTGIPATPAPFEVVALTDETVGAYTIDDVVLPLPGHSVMFPTNAIGIAYQKLLTTDGVDMASWRGAAAQMHQFQQLGGAYRHLIKKPTDVTAVVRTYASVNTPLVLTDVDKLLKRSLTHVDTCGATVPSVPEPSVSVKLEPTVPMKLEPTVPMKLEPTVPMKQEPSVPVKLEPTVPVSPVLEPVVPVSVSGKLEPAGDVKTELLLLATADAASSDAKRVQRALVLEFSLDVGSDATIAVRELMKQSSSMHVQWQLADRATQSESSGTAVGGKSMRRFDSSTGTSSTKRMRVGAVLGSSSDKKIIAQKKTQVSIGRPGFSLGKH